MTENFRNWDFDEIWSLDEETSYPYLRVLTKPSDVLVGTIITKGKGTEEKPVLVSTKEQLEIMKYAPGSWYRLQNDIDLEGSAWIPVGSLNHPFFGNLNGNGYRIFNFTVTNTESYSGLFGYLKNATVTDVILSDFRSII